MHVCAVLCNKCKEGRHGAGGKAGSRASSFYILSCISRFLRQRERPQQGLLRACGWRERSSSCGRRRIRSVSTSSAHFAAAVYRADERPSRLGSAGTPAIKHDVESEIPSGGGGQVSQGISPGPVCYVALLSLWCDRLSSPVSL